MIALDTNLLVHAHQREASLHGPASALVRTCAESRVPWGICVHTLVEFYAVATQPRLWRAPSTPAQAWDQIASWRESPSLRLLGDLPGLVELLAELSQSAQVHGGMIHDARIAAMCLLHGVDELWTIDRDFGRFPRLRTRNPLMQ